MTGDIPRHAGEAAFSSDRRGSFRLVGIFPSGQNMLEVSAAPGKSLHLLGIRLQLATLGRSTGGEKLGESRGYGVGPETALYARVGLGNLPFHLPVRRIFACASGKLGPFAQTPFRILATSETTPGRRDGWRFRATPPGGDRGPE